MQFNPLPDQNVLQFLKQEVLFETVGNNLLLIPGEPSTQDVLSCRLGALPPFRPVAPDHSLYGVFQALQGCAELAPA